MNTSSTHCVKGLTYTVQHGEPHSYEHQTPRAEVEPLSGEQIRRVLARLPELEVEKGAEADNNKPTATVLPQHSAPPPKTGRRIETTFPPREEVSHPVIPVIEASWSNEPLRVLSYAPQGDIGVAPALTVVFSQPMAPVSGVEQWSSKKHPDLPIRLSPEPQGVWQWLDPQTLQFLPQSGGRSPHAVRHGDRFPMSTRYRVEIPKGAKSLSGATMEQALTWNFTTSPLKLIRWFPHNSPQPLDPVILLEFDQCIEPDALLPFITVSSKNPKRTYTIQLIDEEEAKRNKEAQE